MSARGEPRLDWCGGRLRCARGFKAIVAELREHNVLRDVLDMIRSGDESGLSL